MKRNILFCIFITLFSVAALAQEAVPKPKSAAIPKPMTKEEKREANKNKTLEQRIEEAVPVDVKLPKASVRLPGNKSVSSVDDAKKMLDKNKKDFDKFKNETLPDLGLKVSEKSKKLKKALKKDPNKFDGRKYEGLEVEHQYIKQGSGSRMTFIDFYTLNVPNTKPSPYLRDVFWYDMKGNRITNALSRDEKNNKIMHGPYKKYVGENLMEEGFYYIGSKHSRWEKYDKNFNLVDKEIWEKGFLSESIISYYDEAKTKVKEVIPRLYNKVSGDYFLFNESGTLAEQGKMDDSVKVGLWIEYFPSGNRRKKETQYGKDCYDGADPFLLREYDEKGKIIFESKEGKRF